jgi:hypothetical protein
MNTKSGGATRRPVARPNTIPRRRRLASCSSGLKSNLGLLIGVVGLPPITFPLIVQ